MTLETLVAELKPYLLGLATIYNGPDVRTYGQVGRIFNVDPHGTLLRQALEEVSRQTYAEAGVLLSALVVNEKDGIPGKGFYPIAKEFGREISDWHRCWLKEVEKIRQAYQTVSSFS